MSRVNGEDDCSPTHTHDVPVAYHILVEQGWATFMIMWATIFLSSPSEGLTTLHFNYSYMREATKFIYIFFFVDLVDVSSCILVYFEDGHNLKFHSDS